jgi:DNA-binding IclR family transcriptional regulator
MSNKLTSLEKALKILKLMYHNGDYMGISEISRKSGFPKSSVHRLLLSLEQEGFVQKDNRTSQYWLGMELYVMGTFMSNRMSIIDKIAPHVKKLNEEIGEVINVSVLEKNTADGPRSLLIHKEVGTNQSLAVYPPVGASSECFCSAVGKCLMAFTDSIDFSQYKDEDLFPYTEFTMMKWQEIEEACQQVRMNGYAIEDEERSYGLICIGVPVLNKQGQAEFAISISGAKSRILEEKIPQYVDILKAKARELGQYF